MADSILETLRELEAYLAGEVKTFDDSVEIAKAKGMSKAALYCTGVSHAYSNALGKLRQAIPSRLVRDIANG